jgi:hypothetical protein
VDHIEVLCLINPDGLVTASDIIDRAREREDIGGELQEFREELEAIEEEVEFDSEPGIAAAEINDRWSRMMADCFAHLAFRQAQFAPYYPFRVGTDGHSLSLRRPQTAKHRFYLFLLLAGSLRHFQQKDRTVLTSLFEVVSSYALEEVLPKGAVVRIFGKHPLNRGRYSGKLWTKLQLLASDLSEQVVTSEENFKPTNTGDAGLDIVAWIKTGDTAPGFLTVFGQCACSPADWVTKQSETSWDIWKNFMSFAAYPARMTFIPFCFRKPTGGWYNDTQIHNTIIMDRVRLVFALRGRIKAVEALVADRVHEYLARKQGLV